MRFYVGIGDIHHAHHFDGVFISVNRLRDRKSDFKVGDWIMDSGAFSTLLTHGCYPHPVEEYSGQIRRWATCGNLLAAVTQDYMCEPFMLEITGMTVAEHQRFTIERYDAILNLHNTDTYIMPVLQGYQTREYLDHLDQYGERLTVGAWVGVGSVCKRNRNCESIATVLSAIKSARPDLKLHGFGLKITALRSGLVRSLLHSADSMAWSYSARMKGGNAHDWREARRWVQKLRLGEDVPIQGRLAL